MKNRTISLIISCILLIAVVVMVYVFLHPSFAGVDDYVKSKGNESVLIDSFDYNGDIICIYSKGDVVQYYMSILGKKGNVLFEITPTYIVRELNQWINEENNIYNIEVISNTPRRDLDPEDDVIVSISVFSDDMDINSVTDSCGTYFSEYKYGNDDGAYYVGKIKVRDIDDYSVSIKGNEISVN